MSMRCLLVLLKRQFKKDIVFL